MLYISHAVMETGKILKPVVQLLSSVDAVYFVFVVFFFFSMSGTHQYALNSGLEVGG